VAGLLFGAAVVGLDVDLEDDPHAASKATASKALPPMAVAVRPRLVMPPKRGLGVTSLRSPALFKRSLIVKFFLSPGMVVPACASGGVTVVASDRRVTSVARSWRSTMKYR
jgi:hypothetical protein